MPGECKFLWISFCCLNVVAAAAPENPSRSQDYPALVREYARRIKNQITSVELASKTSFDNPDDRDRPNDRPPRLGPAPPVTAKVYYKDGKMRVDLDIKTVKWGDDGLIEDIYPFQIISSYDGQTTYELTEGRTLVICREKDARMQYSGYLKVGRIMGSPMYELFENMEITCKGSVDGPEGRLHNLSGLYTAPTDPNDKPLHLRFEMAAAEAYGFAVISADIYTEAAELSGRYIASNFAEVTRGIWLPRIVEEQQHKPDGRLHHKSVAELEFKAINGPIDDSIFELEAPPGGTVYERIGKVLVDQSTFSQEIKLDPFDTPGGPDPAEAQNGPLEDAHLPPKTGLNPSPAPTDTNGEDTQPPARENNPASLVPAADQNLPAEGNRLPDVEPIPQPRAERQVNTDSRAERRKRGLYLGLIGIASALVIGVAIIAIRRR